MGVIRFRDRRSRLAARDRSEDHRSASPLELLFDLTFVVATAQIATQLAHGIESGHTSEALGPFLMIYFAIWWAWMNFTWFASGYDNDDAIYRVCTLVQMGGVLVLVAGVPAGFEDGDYRAITIGYAIMRLGLIAHWARVAVDDPLHRAMALRNVIGFGALQVLWLSRLALSPEWQVLSVAVLAALDMAVPLWADRAGQASWHPGHIAERYGLFTILLLGESIFATTTAVQGTIASRGGSVELLTIAASGLVLAFTLWWLYFLQPAGQALEQRRDLSFVWGYGHFGIFISLAALGAGLEVAVFSVGGHVESADWQVAASVCWPVAVVLALIWAVHAPLAPGLVIDWRVLITAAVAAALLPALAPLLGVQVVIACAALVCAAAVVAGSSPARTQELPTST